MNAELLLGPTPVEPSGNEYTPGDDPFYALLNTPNGVAAVFLIRDHGRELRIEEITKIKPRGGGGKNMCIYFA